MIKKYNGVRMGFWLLLVGLQPSASAVKPAAKQSPVVQLKNFGSAVDFAVAPDGSVWLLGASEVQHLTAEGNLIKQFGGIQNINKIALAPDGSVWVVNAFSQKIQNYTADGVLVAEFGTIGTGTGQINALFLLDLQIAADGSVWLLDIQNNRVQHYRDDGTFIAQFGNEGTAAGQFTRPAHLALAKDESVWVSDGAKSTSFGLVPSNYRLQHFRVDGSFIEQFGNQNSQDELGIADIAVTADGSIWVADMTSFQHF